MVGMKGIYNSIKSIGTIPCIFILFYFLDPFNLGFIFGYLLMGFFVINSKLLKLLPDFDIVLLFIFCFVYALFYSFDPAKGSQFIFIYMIFPSCFYLFGKYIAKRILDYKQLFNFIFALGVVFSIIALVSTSYDILINGFVQTKRDVSKIWGGDPINATGMASYLFANMCIPAIIFFGFSKKKIWFYIFSATIYITSVMCVLRLGSRTQLAISLIILIISVVFKMSSFSTLKNIGVIIVLFIGINLGFSYLNIDKDSDLLASYATRMDNKKYGAATAGGRTERWEKSITNLIEEPLGWPLEEFGYSHNLWFDAARIGGTLSFVILLMFSARAIWKTKKIIGFRKIHNEFRNIILVYAVAFNLQFFVEPTLEGSFNLFVFFCLFQGILNSGLENVRQRAV